MMATSSWTWSCGETASGMDPWLLPVGPFETPYECGTKYIVHGLSFAPLYESYTVVPIVIYIILYIQMSAAHYPSYLERRSIQ